jgi:hypothetical protein
MSSTSGLYSIGGPEERVDPGARHTLEWRERPSILVSHAKLLMLRFREQAHVPS